MKYWEITADNLSKAAIACGSGGVRFARIKPDSYAVDREQNALANRPAKFHGVHPHIHRNAQAHSMTVTTIQNQSQTE